MSQKQSAKQFPSRDKPFNKSLQARMEFSNDPKEMIEDQQSHRSRQDKVPRHKKNYSTDYYNTGKISKAAKTSTLYPMNEQKQKTLNSWFRKGLYQENKTQNTADLEQQIQNFFDQNPKMNQPNFHVIPKSGQPIRTISSKKQRYVKYAEQESDDGTYPSGQSYNRSNSIYSVVKPQFNNKQNQNRKIRPSTARVDRQPVKKDIFEAQNHNEAQQQVAPSFFKPKTPAVWSPAGGQREVSKQEQVQREYANKKNALILKQYEKKLLKNDVNKYLKETISMDGKCISCAACMSPQHRILQYKYPNQVQSSYIDKIGGKECLKSLKNTPQKTNFNYDKVRGTIHREYKAEREKSLETIGSPDERSDYKSTYPTSYQIHGNNQKRGAKMGKDVAQMRNQIKLQAQVGNNPNIKMNCFLDSTSYKRSFIPADMMHKNVAIKPNDQPIQKHKFDEKSSYGHVFGSDVHKIQSGGQYLMDKKKDQASRAKDIMIHQRKGQMNMVQKKLTFQADTYNNYTQSLKNAFSQPISPVNKHIPVDNLFCSHNQVKMLATTQNQNTFVDTKISQCGFKNSQSKHKSENKLY